MSEFSGCCSHVGPRTSVERGQRKIARCRRSDMPTPKPSERCDPHTGCDSRLANCQGTRKNRNSRIKKLDSGENEPSDIPYQEPESTKSRGQRVHQAQACENTLRTRSAI